MKPQEYLLYKPPVKTFKKIFQQGPLTVAFKKIFKKIFNRDLNMENKFLII